MNEKISTDALFNLETVFEVDDYLFTYRDDLTDERSDAEVASLVMRLELDSPMKILDLACGFGRHTNRLAALGHSVTGVEHMPDFLALARQKATEMGVQVDYQQGDMRQVNFVEIFDRVLLLFSSFGYFEDGENEQVVENSEVDAKSRAHPPHKHGGYEAFYMLEGEGVLDISDETYILRANESAMIDPQTLHGLRNEIDLPMRYMVILYSDET